MRLELRRANRIPHDAGLALAPPDPDGPPLGALTWPVVHRVVRQQPAAGAALHRWDSLVVVTVPVDDGAAAAPRSGRSTGSAVRGAAGPDRPAAVTAGAGP